MVDHLLHGSEFTALQASLTATGKRPIHLQRRGKPRPCKRARLEGKRHFSIFKLLILNKMAGTVYTVMLLGGRHVAYTKKGPKLRSGVSGRIQGKSTWWLEGWE